MMAAKDFSLFLCFCFSFFSYAVLIYADSTEDKNAYQYMTNSFKYINGGDTLSQSKNQIKLGPFEADLKFHARLHELLQHPSHDVSGISPSMILSQRNQVAKSNLLLHDNRKITSENPWSSPGSIAKGFVIPTLTGTLHYPGAIINESSPILFHSFNPHSGFLDCMWNCSGTMPEFVNNSPNLTHYVFMSNSPDASKHIQWMHDRLSAEIRKQQRYDLLPRLHFIPVPVYELGTWMQELLWLWSCPDHNCGLDQILIQDTTGTLKSPLVLKRLDARYDWLPSPSSTFGNRTLRMTFVSGGGCKPVSGVKGMVVMTTNGMCSYFNKVSAMERSGAIAVLIQTDPDEVVQDMNCNESECAHPLSIPASMIPHQPSVSKLQNLTVQYQKSPSENFFFGIYAGRLAEVGWFLYPTFRFLEWQAQWFSYKTDLDARLAEETGVLEIPVFNHTIMQGANGARANITLPDLSELQKYSNFELDASMSCAGELDSDCPHWDHTVQLYICCNMTSDLCDMELGRWISPFRRRIGRWLTPVHSLLPLLTSSECRFTMKTVPWALPWQPSLTLRFSGKHKASWSPSSQDETRAMNERSGSTSNVYPYITHPLYHPQFTFDKNYNKNFATITFSVPESIKKVELVAVITGHGSDENGCGEFCVTSHHFVVNGNMYNKTFDTAGSPFGCADRVLSGVEPNEHGTWLYGRDGWCDGQQVSPWVIDITASVTTSGFNDLSYFGFFNGMDPDPKSNPGIMIFSSYMTYYKEL